MLLAVLLGQLLLGLGRGSAEGKSTKAPERQSAKRLAADSWLQAEGRSLEVGQQAVADVVPMAGRGVESEECGVERSNPPAFSHRSPLPTPDSRLPTRRGPTGAAGG